MESQFQIEKNEPWKKIKDNKDEAGEILGQSIIIISAISSMLEPFLPGSAIKLQEIIFNKKINNWSLVLPVPGTEFQKPDPLFEKLDEEEVLKENEIISNE